MGFTTCCGSVVPTPSFPHYPLDWFAFTIRLICFVPTLPLTFAIHEWILCYKIELRTVKVSDNINQQYCTKGSNLGGSPTSPSFVFSFVPRCSRFSLLVIISLFLHLFLLSLFPAFSNLPFIKHEWHLVYWPKKKSICHWKEQVPWQITWVNWTWIKFSNCI